MQETENEIIPHYELHWGTQNQMRIENYPQCATQCATQWGSQNHMKRAIIEDFRNHNAKGRTKKTVYKKLRGGLIKEIYFQFQAPALADYFFHA